MKRHTLPFAALLLLAFALFVGCAAPQCEPCDKCKDCDKCPAPAKEEPKAEPKPKVKRPFREGEAFIGVQDDGILRCNRWIGEVRQSESYADIIEWATEVIRRDYQQRDDAADIGMTPRPARVVWWLTHDGLLDPSTDRVWAYPVRFLKPPQKS